MNTRLYLFPILFLALAFTGFSQSYAVTAVYQSNANLGCDSIVTIGVSAQQPTNSTANDYTLWVLGGNFQNNSSIQMMINWGDGSVTTHGGVFASTGMLGFFNPPLEHSYSNTTINYNVTVTVYSAGMNISYTFNVDFVSNCTTSVYTVASLNCSTLNPAILNSIPVILTNSANQSTNITVANTQTVNVSSLPAGSYVYNIDPAWLVANGLNSLLNNQTVVYNGPGTTINLQFYLNCPPPSQNCVSGIVFCDANGNGSFDNGETVFPNTQLVVSFNNSNVTVTTDVNGQYSYNLPTSATAPIIVSIANSFFQQNPGIPNPGPQTNTSFVPCGTNTNNFALQNCTPQQLQGCISGYVFCDNNGNGFFNSGDVGYANASLSIQLQNGTNVTVYTDQNGFFSFSDTINAPNQYAIVSLNTSWVNSVGVPFNQYVYTTYFDCNMAQPVFFAATCATANPCADLWCTVQPWIGYYQNQNNMVKINWGNYGPQAPGNYTMTLVFPAGVIPVTSSIMNPNYVISGNTITWTINSTSAFFQFTDIITFSVPMGIASGTNHQYNIGISSSIDCNAANNYGELNMFVGNSYDPNDKTVNKPEIISPFEEDELIYRIRFQNTGTAPAQNIYIMDTLSQYLDWSTFEIVSYSHPMQVLNYGDGIIKFNFPNIWLPDSTTNLEESQGFVTYKITEMLMNAIGHEIENTAYIFFDWNAPIITNTTLNVNNMEGGLDENGIAVMLHPNPVNDVLRISGATGIGTISILDLSGKVVLTLSGQDLLEVDLSNLNAGVYLIRIESTEGTATRRIVKK